MLTNNIKILLVSFVHHIELQNFSNAPRTWQLMNLDPYCQRQKCRTITLVSCNIKYKSFVDIRNRFWLGRLQTWVGSLKSTNLPFSRCHILLSFRNNVGINCTLQQHTVLDSCRHQYGWSWMTLNTRFILKCLLCLSTLDVRLLRVSDSTIRIGVARCGGRGVGWRA